MASNGERFALKSRVYTGRIMVDLVCVQEKNNRRQREKEVESQTAAAMATGSPFANFWGKPRRIKSKRDSDPVERTRYRTLTTLLRSGPDLYFIHPFLDNLTLAYAKQFPTTRSGRFYAMHFDRTGWKEKKRNSKQFISDEEKDEKTWAVGVGLKCLATKRANGKQNWQL